MENLIIGIILGAATFGAGLAIGASKPKEEDIISEYLPHAQVLLPTEKPKPKKPELGAVTRPSAEDLDKKENPRLKEEEEAWDESIGNLGVAKMFTNPFRRGLWTLQNI